LRHIEPYSAGGSVVKGENDNGKMGSRKKRQLKKNGKGRNGNRKIGQRENRQRKIGQRENSATKIEMVGKRATVSQ